MMNALQRWWYAKVDVLRSLLSPPGRKLGVREPISLLMGLALAVGTFVVGAGPAKARERHGVYGAGASGQVILDDGLFGAGLMGWVEDTAADGACAEVWMDFSTRPHHHFDAYAVRVCGRGFGGWGRYNKAKGRSGWTIHGVRTAACTYWPNGTRKCTQRWPHLSVQARTFHLETIRGSATPKPSDPRRCHDCNSGARPSKPKPLPPPSSGGPLYTQGQIRSGKTPYGKCTTTNGKVTCPTVRLADLALPASFAVPRSQRTVKVNAVALEAFRRVVNAIDRAGLGRRINQFQTVSRRQCKSARTGKFISDCVSLHSWGVAVDINPGTLNATLNGQPLEGVRKVFLAHGFVWGKTFKGNVDPPHFQFAKL